MKRDNTLSTAQKALSINLDENRYGSIVEIGAGQEVARHFFKVGAAAGTIAKTSSAYDMNVSDAIYGKVGRYVSRERVEAMASYEYSLCLERLQKVRPKESTFFSYAATVTAQNYKGTNECHGWIGLQIQMRPRELPCTVVCHVRMLDNSNQLQSEALGVLGVNLIHSCFNHVDKPKWIIESLSDGLGKDRIEIDLINFSGPAFEYLDNRLMNMHLVQAWLARAVMFNPQGEPVVPRDVLYKKPVNVIRGSFRPPTKAHSDMAKAGLAQMQTKENVDPKQCMQIAEISMSLLVNQDNADDFDFLIRTELANAMGFHVLLSDYVRYFSLRSWLRRYTQAPIAILMKARDIDYIFDRQLYQTLEGGTLEGLGKLFAAKTSVIVYPNKSGDNVITLNDIEFPTQLRLVVQQLMENNKLVACEGYHSEMLGITIDMLKDRINNHGDWESLVDPAVAKVIKRHNLFGCQ